MGRTGFGGLRALLDGRARRTAAGGGAGGGCRRLQPFDGPRRGRHAGRPEGVSARDCIDPDDRRASRTHRQDHRRRPAGRIRERRRCRALRRRGPAAWRAQCRCRVGSIEFRIGINVGDVIIDDDDIFGDGVNIAARLEALAEPGGICISAQRPEQVRGKARSSPSTISASRSLKNIAGRYGSMRRDSKTVGRELGSRSCPTKRQRRFRCLTSLRSRCCRSRT